MQPSTWRAPSITAAMLLGAALPRSLWQWTLMTALSMFGTFCLMRRMRSANSDGRA